eukprot:1128303-Prymnesium_polylepis.2
MMLLSAAAADTLHAPPGRARGESAGAAAGAGVPLHGRCASSSGPDLAAPHSTSCTTLSDFEVGPHT